MCFAKDFFGFCVLGGFPGSSVVKNLPTNAGGTGDAGLNPWVGKIPCRRKWQATPVFLPRKSHDREA